MRQVMWWGSIVAASAISALAAHHFSKPHYLELGNSYGNIDARVAVIREIDAALPRVRICSDKEYKDWKEIVSVKSGAVYVKPIDETSVLVCRAR